jgi:hypothetical protein
LIGRCYIEYVFVAYVDESGTDDASAFIGVGGLISTGAKWNEFKFH